MTRSETPQASPRMMRVHFADSGDEWISLQPGDGIDLLQIPARLMRLPDDHPYAAEWRRRLELEERGAQAEKG